MDGTCEALGPEQSIETERLRLRPLEMGDAAFIARESSRPEIARMTGVIPSPNPPLAVEGFILIMRAREQTRGDRVRLITERKTAAQLGVIGLHPGGRDGAWEIGYWLARSAWGRGYASEAAHGILLHASAAGLTAFTAAYFEDNPASGRVLEKLGFADTGQTVKQFSLGRLGEAPSRRMRLEAAHLHKPAQTL